MQEKLKGTTKSGFFNLLHCFNNAYYWLIFIAFFCETTISYVIWVLNKISIFETITPYIVPSLVLFFLLALFLTDRSIFKKIRTVDFFFTFFVILLLILSIFIHSQTYDVVMERYFWKVFTVCIPFYFIGICINVDEKTMKFLSVFSKVSLVIGFLYFYYMLNFGNPEAIEEDNMGLAYNYLLIELFVVISAFKYKKFNDILLAVLGGFLILVLGTRGPVVLLAAFVVICVFKKIIHNRGWKKSIIILVVIFLGIGLAIFYDDVLLWLVDVTSQIGLSSRVLEKLLDKNLLESVERSQITDLLLQKISEKPFLGYGIAGEWQFVEWNAHNMYITFLSNYGIILGGAFVVAIAIIFILALWKNHNENAQYLLLMFGCLVFIKGFFAGEPLTMEVFFLIGLGLNQKRCMRTISVL